ncbi:MAG: hypothetical protein Q7T55_19460 [Solirubrobacteraceae bacterium]|nr:hypothetical protein [Solirubrobacteraceae bacterium]
MNSISVISSIAMAVGLAAALPQIVQMVSTRSSGGQSVLGWGMGLVTNLSMAYVNLFGFGAKALMISNVFSALLCVTAMLLIVRFGAGARGDLGGADHARQHSAPAAVGDADPAIEAFAAQLRALPPLASESALVDLPTTEFVAISEAVLAARDRRERGSTPRARHAETLAVAA